MNDVLRLTIEAAFGSFEDRVLLEGPDFLLSPEVALALTMIIHELTTNAVKYGALSNQTGTVSVSWTVEPGEECDALTLTWQERGGPRVEEPSRQGFGTKLINSGITSRRGTTVDIRYEPEGLVCVLEANLEPLAR